jgi:hypothetical protein
MVRHIRPVRPHTIGVAVIALVVALFLAGCG